MCNLVAVCKTLGSLNLIKQEAYTSPSLPHIIMSEVKLNITRDVVRASETLYKAFDDSHAFDYITKKFFNLPVDEYVSKDRINAITHYYVACYHDSNGEVVEANDYDAVAVFSLPNQHLPKSLTNDPHFNQVFFHDLKSRLAEVIPEDIHYYYLFMIGKDLTRKDTKGSVRKIFEEYKKRADAENCAIVLEAIAEHARSVYEYFGFKNYKTFHYGVGEVNEQGQHDPNGKGFTGYLMIYHKDGDKVLRE